MKRFKQTLAVFTALFMLICMLPAGIFAEEGDVEINETNFPDANFRAWVSTNCDSNNDNSLSSAEIAAVTTINVSKNWDTPDAEKIADLTGIEYFTALTSLDCNYNKLTSLDVSANTALQKLNCHDNKLTSLNVNGATALTKLDCCGNQLTELNVSNNIALKELLCVTNQLMQLDVSLLSNLTELDCGENQLTQLDVSNNTVLEILWCQFNQLTTLDVSSNIALNVLACFDNQLTTLDVSANNLNFLMCMHNQLTELNLSNSTDLETLYCQGNQLSELDVSNNTALTGLMCGCNNIEGYMGGNLLTSLDLSNNTALGALFCDDNQLTSLNLSQNTALTAQNFSCNNNQYTVHSNPFDLTTLPGNFDVTKASNWQGGTVEENMLTFSADQVTYTYNCENDKTATFTLLLQEAGTITVVNPRANKTYNAYRVFDLTYSPANAPVNYAYSIQGGSPWFDVIQDYADNHDHGLKLTPSAADPDLYVVEFASAENQIEGYDAFDPVDFSLYLRDNVPEDAEVVAKRDSGPTPTGPIKLTTDGAVPNSASGNIYVPLGYYFVTTSIGTFCSLDSTDPNAYIYDKNEVPGWDNSGKVVAAEDPYATPHPGSWGSTSDETIGSEAWFKIMAHVPAYEYGHQVKQYTFTDTLDNGFTYDAGSLKITLYTGLDENGVPIANPSMVLYDSVANPTHPSAQGVEVELPGASNTITVELQLTGNGAIANYYPDAHIVIEYTAHVDQDAVYDNENTANMNWTWVVPNPVPNPPPDPTPDPEQPAVPEAVKTHTYVYGLPFNKTIKGSATVTYLPGAEFELYRDEDCRQLISLVVDNDLPEGAPAQEPEGSVQWTYYRVADATETAADNFTSETIKAGRAVIWGLAPGTYYLLETKAPDGYNPLADPFPITICAVDNLETTEINEDNVGDNGYVNADTFNIENAAGAELPGVGGIGTKIFYIVGALLMIAAAVLLVVRKKMSVQE